jgi:hypothetical protein
MESGDGEIHRLYRGSRMRGLAIGGPRQLELWGVIQSVIEDLDKNGTVGLGDFEIIAANWLWEK